MKNKKNIEEKIIKQSSQKNASAVLGRAGLTPPKIKKERIITNKKALQSK